MATVSAYIGEVRALYIRCLTATIGLTSSLGCGSAAPATEVSAGSAGAAPSDAQAGFLDLSPRKVRLNGREVSLDATSKIFYNFRPAQQGATTRPTIVLFNGFAADVVRAFGTGPNGLQADGSVAENPDSLTRFANLLYLDPRQAGFSYDVLDGRVVNAAEDCSQDVFSEYVDAADVLLAALRFMNGHSELKGPVYWLGESYAGVRISWMVAYLRQAWSLVPYQDETLQSALDSVDRSRYLSGQILLQPWLAGAAHASAIRAACRSPSLLAAVQQSVSSPCATQDACDCAKENLRSPYDYAATVEAQKARFFAADSAQVSPANAESLYGVPFEKIPGLSGAERGRGFKCSVADDETPDQSALVSLLGELPNGQSYNLAYSPLMPGKGSLDPDWQTQNSIGTAFLANVQQVPTFISDGKRDLVVPESALSPALRAVAGAVTISETPSEITLGFATGARVISIRHYTSSGHMITMNEPHALAVDLSAWLADHSP